MDRYLFRGAKAGLVAGVVLGLFIAVVATPMIGAAEHLAGEHDHGGHHDATASDSLTALTGDVASVLGGAVWGVVLGIVTFGLIYYFLEPAIPGTGTVKSVLLAATGFVTVSGAPWLVLPPQPPGVEQALSTDLRLLLYAGMMVAGLAACLLAGYLYTRLRCRGRPLAAFGAAIPPCLLVVLSVLGPAPPVEQSLPASFVAAFRAQVVFGQALLWTSLAGVHAWLLGRDDGPVAVADPTPDGLDSNAD